MLASDGGTGETGAAVWKPLVTADGSWTLVHPVHGEACHSRSGAWLEARVVYAEPCRLADRGPGAVRLLDVGTGVGLNLAAALRAIDAAPDAFLEVDTLERDPTVIERALSFDAECARGGSGASRAPWERWHAGVLAALATCLRDPGVPTRLGEEGSRVCLRLGDARATVRELSSEGYDAVFLDPFSPSREPELWTPEFLAEVARLMAPGARLSTYTASTRVRAGLLAAGLEVGPGPGMGNKVEGTLACKGGRLPAFEDHVRRKIEAAVVELLSSRARPGERGQGREHGQGGGKPS